MTATDLPKGLMEEYAQLREEIRTYLSRRQQSKNFAFMIALAVVGLDSSNLIKFGDLLFPVCALLISFLWFDEIGRIKAVFRVATYIEVFIESRVPALRWETIGGKHPIQKGAVRRVVSNAEFPVLFVGFVLMSYLRFQGPHPTVAQAIAVVGALIVLYLGITSILVSRGGREREKAKWLSVYDNILAEERNTAENGTKSGRSGAPCS